MLMLRTSMTVQMTCRKHCEQLDCCRQDVGRGVEGISSKGVGWKGGGDVVLKDDRQSEARRSTRTMSSE
ncbi:hypothetical protein AN958_00067 [Leucoagaricus sp. SymC.cos]|nr:hypothetical protein AN958_00067 [Leucoagaricus sp. SymC.cos]